MGKILVLCGLPGSGKTTYAESLKDKYTKIYDFDQMLDVSEKGQKKWAERKFAQVKKALEKYEQVVLDGLFLTEQSQKDIMETFPDREIEFHYWKPERKICMWNDAFRRKKDSHITILKAPLDKPNYQGTALVEHEVKQKDLFQVFCEQHKLETTFYSESWCTGGQYSNPFDGEFRSVLEDAPLEVFEEFDDVLSNVVPELSSPMYEKIKQQCVDIEVWYDDDHYARNVSWEHYACDTKKMFDFLIENNLIERIGNERIYYDVKKEDFIVKKM